MARETITTYGGLIQAAILLKNNADLWIVTGRQTAWSDEDIPDSPTPGTTDVEEPLVALKCLSPIMAREVSLEDYNAISPSYRRVHYNEQGIVYFELVPDVDAFTKNATNIYCEAVYAPLLGHPEGDFRIYGVYSGLNPAAGYETAEYLAPANVDIYGLLLTLSHGKVYETTETGRAVTIPMLISLF